MASVNLEVSGPIARVMLNRPDFMNALDKEARDRLLSALRTVEANEAVRCLILGGVGPNFMSGADVKEFAQMIAREGVNLQSEFESTATGTQTSSVSSLSVFLTPSSQAFVGSSAAAAWGWPCPRTLLSHRKRRPSSLLTFRWASLLMAGSPITFSGLLAPGKPRRF